MITSNSDVFATPDSFEHAQRVAKVFAQSALVPQHFHNKVADCLIAYQVAKRLNEDPLAIMQNMFVVHGRPGWSTSYMIARANKSGIFRGPIRWKSEGKGDDLEVRAIANLADGGEQVDVSVSLKMAKAEGWTKNSKYATMGEHMLRWRSAAMLIRLFAPEIMLGFQVIEEIEPPPAEPRDVTPKSAAAALEALVADTLKQAEAVPHDPETGEIYANATLAEDAYASMEASAAADAYVDDSLAANSDAVEVSDEERLALEAKQEARKGRKAFDAWFLKLSAYEKNVLKPHMGPLVKLAAEARI